MEQSKRPVVEQKDEPKQVRHFNTSRTLKAVNDTSTIDFAYLPAVEDGLDHSMIRVPILPDNYSASHGPVVEEIVSLSANEQCDFELTICRSF